MSHRLESAFKGLILVGLALFLTSSMVNGTLLFYINRRFAWLTWVAAILLLIIAFAYQQTSHAVRQHGSGEGQHHHHHGNEGVWIAILLVALPLVLGVLVPARPLGAQAVGLREMNTGGVGLGNDENVLTRAVGERNILDWLRVFGAAEDPAAFDGQNATVQGFVFRDASFAADQFMLSRFVVSCCVADATAVGLVTSWPDASSLPLDTWLEVRGKFQAGQFEGEPRPILIAESVTPISPPNQPYLYP
jgi:uncharacterized repeat protein (TIGR03943 family)